LPKNARPTRNSGVSSIPRSGSTRSRSCGATGGRFEARLKSDFEELFASFARHGVKAIIVGAHAVAYHAKPRYTKDLEPVFFLGRAELIRNKKAVGRRQDLVDLEWLDPEGS